jgi:integrase/recombinase XerD
MTTAYSAHFFGKLYDRMAEDLHLAGMSERTHAGYLRAVRQLADYCKTPPAKISEDQLRRYFLHLKNERKFAYGSLRVAFSGIKFFYTRTCKRNWDTLAKMKLQNINALPEVLTGTQVHRIIDACTTDRMAAYFWTVYSLGLRMQEGLNLQVGDVDSQRMMVHVHRGKGAKDRYVPLPTSTLQLLRRYWSSHRHKRLPFPADSREHKGMAVAATSMSPTAVQGAMKKITTQIDFGKKVSIHTLRHSYATHLLEAGVSLKVIQKYMGHSSLQTTMVYLHLNEIAEVNAREKIEQIFLRR